MPDASRSLDAFLVAGARLGDRRALERLAAHRGPRLLAHARRLCDDAETARDLVQEAWVEILRGLGGLRDDHAFLPWALRIVTRRAARDVRGRATRRAMARDWAAENCAVTAPQGDSGADVAALHRAMATLPAAQRAALALFYLEEMSVAEVAVALDVPPGTVKTRLMHARNRLRALLEGEADGST
jgi:RNA polymerase sigma factor (sigma-70 family)